MTLVMDGHFAGRANALRATYAWRAALLAAAMNAAACGAAAARPLAATPRRFATHTTLRVTPRRAPTPLQCCAASSPRIGPAAVRLRFVASRAQSSADAAAAPAAAAALLPLDAFLAAHGGTASLLGFAVVRHETGSLVGHVAEVLSVADGEVVMGVSGDAAAAGDPLLDALTRMGLPESERATAESTLLRVQGAGRAYAWECYIPLAAALVPGVEAGARRVRIAPPRGLVESGELPHLLDWLRAQLGPYLTRCKSGLLGGRPLRLPGRRELLRVGRADLVAAITRAGGFAAVAAQLRLRGVRKPAGYWDDPAILAQELREFVDSHWSEHKEDDGAPPYYYNDISGEVRWDAPRSLLDARRHAASFGAGAPEWSADDSSSGDDSDEGDDDAYDEDGDVAGVMPPQRALAAAGRWDLVQAVVAHGGSRAVAAELGWLPAPRWIGRHLAALDALAAELRAFCADDADADDEEAAAATMPTYAALREAGRDDLAAAVARHGGTAAVAARLGLQPRRSPRGRWAQRAAAVSELRAFVRARSAAGAAGPATRRALPTRTELQAAGRADLVYALNRHGRRPLAAALRLRPARVRCAKRSFAEARDFARSLRLGSQPAWRDWCASGQRPSDIPADPYHAYADAGWASWPDFLGYTAHTVRRVGPKPPPPPPILPLPSPEQMAAWALAAPQKADHIAR